MLLSAAPSTNAKQATRTKRLSNKTGSHTSSLFLAPDPCPPLCQNVCTFVTNMCAITPRPSLLSSPKVVTKRRVKLTKQFKCPFCSNDDTVECKMDFKAGIGSLSCRLCGASFQMPIHHLHEPVDVFSEWLDDCEAAQNQRLSSDVAARYQEEDEEDDDDDNIPESSGLGSSKKNKAVTGSGKNKSAPERKQYTDVGDSDNNDDDDDDE
jgi:transcription elongation factor Elf1